jgi:hypothetical protein
MTAIGCGAEKVSRRRREPVTTISETSTPDASAALANVGMARQAALATEPRSAVRNIVFIECMS